MSWKGNIDTHVTVFAYATYGNCTFPPGEKKEVVVTPSQLEYAADNGYDNAPEAWQENLIDVLRKLNDALTNPNHKLRNDPHVNYPDLVSGYLNTMEEQPLRDLQKTVDPVQNPTGEGTMTPEDMIKQGEADEERITSGTAPTTGDDIIDKATKNAANEVLNPLGALDTSVDVDDKGSIKPIIDTFISGLGQLPVVTFFTELKNVGFSGDCNVTLSLPNPFTNTVSEANLSFCQYETTFDFMGSCLLMLCGITWLFYLFEG